MALAEVFETMAGPGAPVEFRAYDGSVAGAIGSPIKMTIRSPVAVSYLAQAPGALGLARAYVSGHLTWKATCSPRFPGCRRPRSCRSAWPSG